VACALVLWLALAAGGCQPGGVEGSLLGRDLGSDQPGRLFRAFNYLSRLGAPAPLVPAENTPEQWKLLAGRHRAWLDGLPAEQRRQLAADYPQFVRAFPYTYAGTPPAPASAAGAGQESAGDASARGASDERDNGSGDGEDAEEESPTLRPSDWRPWERKTQP